MPLHAYLPQDRRRALAAGAELPERCDGAVLFYDVSGFTALTEQLSHRSGPRLGVDELAQRLNLVHQLLINEVERFGGSVVALAGDGMTCWFDDADGRAARRAAACANAMQRAMHGVPLLSIKIGVSAGAALRVVVGDPAIQRIDLLAGATVARAVAAESVAERGEVFVDPAMADALRHDGHRIDSDPREARTSASGEVYCPLETDFVPSDAPPAEPAPDSDLDNDQLRSWLLPFVFERETASGGLFATDLRPTTVLYLRVALGVAPVQPGVETERKALEALVADVQRTLQQHGGVLLEVSVDAFGTCLYGNFGAARVHEDDAQRALRAALALVSSGGDPARGAAMQIGLASGTLSVGGYGAPGRRSFGALGDAVNTAARLMALARPGEILVAGRVRQPLGDEQFTFEARSPIRVKGKAEPVPVFAATGVQRRRSVRLQEPMAVLPMVGREAETARLAAAVAAALAGRGQVLRIVGEAGIGKSRLLAEGIRIARRSGLIGCGGACGPGGAHTPYGVWQGVWGAFFDIDPALPQRRQHHAALAALQRLAPAHAEAWPLLGAVLGQDWPDTPFTAALQAKDRKSLLHALLLRCLQAAAAEAAEDGMGLLLVLEDLHAADPLSLELLATLARAVVDTLPVLLMSTQRPAETLGAEAGGDGAGGQLIELRGLGLDDIEPMLRAKLAQRFPERAGPLPRELLQRIGERAQGNPFYVEELLDYLLDRGLDPLQPAAVQALELPSSLHSLVLSRIDRLRAAQQNELKAASVIGREFAVTELQGYCPSLGTFERVATDIDELGRLGFTPPLLPDDASAPVEPRHVFRHPVTQEVAYESIGLDTRAQLHGQYAGRLEDQREQDPSLTLQLAPLLAHHFVRAERALGRGPACRYLRLAGEQAAARFANEEALAHFEQALQWLPADDHRARFELLLQRQAVLDLQGRHAQQAVDLDELARLAPLCSPAHDAAERRAQVAVLRAKVGIERGHYAAARQEALAAVAILDGKDPATAATAASAASAAGGTAAGAAQALRLDAQLQQVQVMLHTGEAAAARPLLDAVLATAREQGLPGAQVAALSALGHLHWHLGEFEPAERGFDQALALAREGSDLRLQLNLLNSLGVVAKSRSRFAEAAQHYGQALQTARRIGDRSGEAMLLNNLGSALLAAGHFHEAGLHGQQAARIFAETGETVLHGLALANCAEAHRELGQPALALEVSAQALALLRESGSRPGEALVLENLGLAEAAAGRPAAGAARLEEAVSIAREIGSAAREASALVHLAQVQMQLGAPAAAGPLLDQAQGLAQQLGSDSLQLELDAARALWLIAPHSAYSPHRSPQGAVARIEPLLARLLGEPEPGVPSPPLALHAAALQVLRAAGDAREPALQARSRQELAERAERIPDAAARRAFFEITEHQVILQ